jgi:hypothetical protein
MQAPGLSTPARYIVSLYESVGSPDHESAFESLQVEAVHATTSKLVADGAAHKVVNVAYYQRAGISEKITDFLSQDSNGRVCVCRLTGREDINQVQAIAKSKGAVALFLLHKPTDHCDLPVFVLPTTVMDKLGSTMRSTAATFELCDSTPDILEKPLSQTLSRLDHDSPSRAVTTGMGDTYSRPAHEGSSDGDDLSQKVAYAQAASEDGQNSNTGWFFEGVKEGLTKGWRLQRLFS